MLSKTWRASGQGQGRNRQLLGLLIVGEFFCFVLFFLFSLQFCFYHVACLRTNLKVREKKRRQGEEDGRQIWGFLKGFLAKKNSEVIYNTGQAASAQSFYLGGPKGCIPSAL